VSSIEPRLLARIRLLVWAVLALGLLGTGTELLLLEHTEDSLQLVPLGVIAVALVAIGWQAVSSRRSSVRLFQLAMLMLIVSGAAGVVLHYRGNMEFQLESDPSLGGLDLFVKVIHAKAPPALAPGTMAFFGLLGLVSVHGHPALGRGGRHGSLEG
jgi:hypothetical protein